MTEDKNEEPFLKLTSLKQLSKVLGVAYRDMLLTIDHSQESYRTFKIRKKRGGAREIEAPDDRLMEIQRKLNVPLQRIYRRVLPDCVHGFVSSGDKSVPSRNIVTNAAVHKGKFHVLNMDLEDFFHSISAARVKNVFMAYPFYFDNDLASFLTILTTVRGRLPMGAPTSPVISNFACFLLDRKLMRMAEDDFLRYTRYADDLTFSSDINITEDVVKKIRAAIEAESFRVNEKKTRIFSDGGRQIVTGLKVNEKVNVDRKYVRSIRAMLHNWREKGIVQAALTNRSEMEFCHILKGKIDFLKMVRGGDDAVYGKLKSQYDVLIKQLSYQFNSTTIT